MIEATATTAKKEREQIRAEYCPQMLGREDEWGLMHRDEPPTGPEYEDVGEFTRHKVWG